MNVQAALKGQYHAALAMLKQAIEQCPDDLWVGGSYRVPFWRVVYHTLFATHLYLAQNEQAFRPWERHREGCQDLPWPPESEPMIGEPYAKAEMLDYWRLCDAMIDAGVDGLDLEAQESGFSWYRTFPKLDHQINNIRHIQHHAALLSGRLRLTNGTDVRWVRRDGEVYNG